MEILQIVGLGLIAAILIVVVKQQRPELVIQLSIAAGVIIFILILEKISGVFSVIEELSRRADIDRLYLSTILKIIGTAYIGEFGAQICRDAGESAVAAKIELAAKILVIILAMPIIVALLESIIRLIP